MNLGQTADNVISRGYGSKQVDNDGSNTGNKGLKIRGSLICGRLSYEINLRFHSQTNTMVWIAVSCLPA